MEVKTEKRKRGGLEFVPLPPRRSEADFDVPHGRVHPGQQSLTAELLETVDPYGRRKRRK